jgi:hypothetical protein
MPIANVIAGSMLRQHRILVSHLVRDGELSGFWLGWVFCMASCFVKDMVILNC